MLLLLILLFLLFAGFGFTIHLLWIGAVIALIILVARAISGNGW